MATIEPFPPSVYASAEKNLLRRKASWSLDMMLGRSTSLEFEHFIPVSTIWASTPVSKRVLQDPPKLPQIAKSDIRISICAADTVSEEGVSPTKSSPISQASTSKSFKSTSSNFTRRLSFSQSRDLRNALDGDRHAKRLDRARPKYLNTTKL